MEDFYLRSAVKKGTLISKNKNKDNPQNCINHEK